MTLPNVLAFAREWMERVLHEGDTAVDATAGNGRDTLHLARCVGENGRVYSFDIQTAALDNTRRLLEENDLLERTTLIQEGHEHAAGLIPEEKHPRLKAAVFNLGFLPGGDKAITTDRDTTVQAVSRLLNIMPAGGQLIVVVYPGHPEGKMEKEVLESYAQNLSQHHVQVLRYEFINQVNDPPLLLIFEKR